MRLKKQATGSYTFTVDTLDDDGAQITPSGSYAATLTDGAGATVGSPFAATYSNHMLTVTVPVSNMPKLDVYTLTWAPTAVGSSQPVWTTEIDLVGGYLFELPALRSMDRAFADTTKYPTAALKLVRDQVEDTIEGPRAAQVAFVRRSRRVSVNGTAPDLNLGYFPLKYGGDYRDLTVPDFVVNKLYSASINGTALTQAEIDAISISDNVLHRDAGVQWPAWPFGRNNVTLHYTHGYDRTPGAITRAALMLAREYLVTSPIPGRATATSIGDQMFRLTIAGRDGVTGLPEVDAAIDQFGRKGYGLG